jgi:hypothetical protein
VKILELCSNLHVPTEQKSPRLAEGQPENPLVEGNLASQLTDYNPLDYLMWSEVAREVSKHPHNTLASLRAQISEVMAYIDREAVIHPCKKFWSRKGAVVDASGNFIK